LIVSDQVLSIDGFAQRSEAHANLLREEPRLFPGREMTALGEFVVVNQFAICLLGPAGSGVMLAGVKAVSVSPWLKRGSRCRGCHAGWFEGYPSMSAVPREVARPSRGMMPISRRSHRPRCAHRYPRPRPPCRTEGDCAYGGECDPRMTGRHGLARPYPREVASLSC
jgi:hypothetical protein